MRQIKFRAWDKEKNEWLFNDFTLIDITTAYANLSLYEVEFMQFTGLLDKNGKEIYEGDIVKYFQPYSKVWDTHTVKWDNLWACFGLFEDGNEWCKESDWVKIKEIEILGNIYESPELLEAK